VQRTSVLIASGWPGAALRELGKILAAAATTMRTSSIPLQAITTGTCSVLLTIIIVTLLGHLTLRLR